MAVPSPHLVDFFAAKHLATDLLVVTERVLPVAGHPQAGLPHISDIFDLRIDSSILEELGISAT